jgi:hypothetical protein
LVAGAFALLWRARNASFASHPEPCPVYPPVLNLLCLLAMPATATGIYAIQLVAGIHGLPPNVIFHLLTVTSVLVLTWALFRILRNSGRRNRLETEPGNPAANVPPPAPAHPTG